MPPVEQVFDAAVSAKKRSGIVFKKLVGLSTGNSPQPETPKVIASVDIATDKALVDLKTTAPPKPSPVQVVPVAVPVAIVFDASPTGIVKQLLTQKIPYEEWPSKYLWSFYLSYRQVRGVNHPEVQSLRNALYLRYDELAQRIARSYGRKKLPSNVSVVDSDDLIQWARTAVFEAIDKYDPGVGTTFEQFVNCRGNRSRIKGGILDGLRTIQEFPREVAAEKRKVFAAMQALRSKLGKKVSPEELIEHYPSLKASIQNTLVWSTVYNQAETVREKNGERVSVPVGETIADYRQQGPAFTDHLAVKISQVLAAVDNELARTVMYNYYYMGVIQEDLARALGISVGMVKELREIALEQIGAKLGRDFFRELGDTL